MKRYLVELVGTFFLVVTIGLVARNPAAGPLGPFAIGSALMVMVYAGGHLSGAHYNPAVSFSIWIRKKLEGNHLVPYWIFQIVGASLGAWVALTLRAGSFGTPLRPNTGSAVLAEALFTFALAWVVLHVATARANSGNSYFGLAIGFTVLTGAVAVGDLSGGAFNPAVTLALGQMGLLDWGAVPLYLVVQLASGAVAALAFRAVSPADH